MKPSPIPRFLFCTIALFVAATTTLTTSSSISSSPSGGLGMMMLAEALQCNCNNGKIVQAVPQCICECLSGFQLPDCDYTISENVRLDVYIDMPAGEFQSSPFLLAVEAGIFLDTDLTKFLYAVPLNQFNKTNILLTMPGYGVKRLMPSIEAREVWVQEQRVEAAYVIPLPEPRSSLANNLPVFNYNSYTITLDSLLWLVAALFLLFWGLVLESCCCFKNDEDFIGEYGYAPDDSPSASSEGYASAHEDEKAARYH